MTLRPSLCPKPMRLPRVEAVTIALGFKCQDGIVLATDTQVTKVDLKFYESKEHLIWGDKFLVGTLYSGRRNAMRRVNQVFSRRIKALGENVTAQSIRDEFERILREIYREHQQDTRGLETLCAISVKGEPLVLLCSKGKLVSESEFECLGVGDSSVIRYLAESFLIMPSAVTCSQVRFLAFYMLAQAKKFCEGCGGDSRVFSITDGGVNWVSSPEMYESVLADVENSFAQLMAMFTARGVSEIEFEDETGRFLAGLGRTRSKVIIQ